MKINEICNTTGLTKKAIEYYQEKGLISPNISDNGYRDFSDKDMSQLKQIALLRRFDLTVSDIREILVSEYPKRALIQIQSQKAMEAENDTQKASLLESLINGKNPDNVMASLICLERGYSIKTKLFQSFPGYFGRTICLQFAPYLNEPIQTEEQKQAYHDIEIFLDNLETFEFPQEVQSELDQVNEFMTDEKIQDMNKSKVEALQDVEAWMKDNKEFLDRYVQYKQSDEYKNSVSFKMSEVLRHFNSTNGYYDVFLPAMRRLSTSYNSYYDKMLKANDIMINKIPEAKTW